MSQNRMARRHHILSVVKDGKLADWQVIHSCVKNILNIEGQVNRPSKLEELIITIAKSSKAFAQSDVKAVILTNSPDIPVHIASGYNRSVLLIIPKDLNKCYSHTRIISEVGRLTPLLDVIVPVLMDIEWFKINCHLGAWRVELGE